MSVTQVIVDGKSVVEFVKRLGKQAANRVDMNGHRGLKQHQNRPGKSK